MDYSKVISVLKYINKELNKDLNFGLGDGKEGNNSGGWNKSNENRRRKTK